MGAYVNVTNVTMKIPLTCIALLCLSLDEMLGLLSLTSRWATISDILCSHHSFMKVKPDFELFSKLSYCCSKLLLISFVYLQSIIRGRWWESRFPFEWYLIDTCPKSGGPKQAFMHYSRLLLLLLYAAYSLISILIKTPDFLLHLISDRIANSHPL